MDLKSARFSGIPSVTLAVLLPTLLCLVLAAIIMRPGAAIEDAAHGLWWVGFGVLCYAGALWINRQLVIKAALPAVLRRADLAAITPPQPRAIRWFVLGVGVGLLLILAEANGRAFSEWRMSIHAQAALLVGGCLLVGWAFGARPDAPNGASEGLASAVPQTHSSSSLRPRSLILLLTLFGLALYLWRSDQTLHIWIDEFHFAEQIVRLWDEPTRPLLPPNPGIAAFTSVYAYLQMLSVGIFGADLFALRFVSAVFGALTIPAVYFLARELLSANPANRRDAQSVALIAALLLALFPPQMHFSRIGLNNIADPLFGVLALAALTRGLRTNAAWAYALAGIMLGLTQYFYEGGKLLYPPLFAAYCVLVVIFWRPHGALRGLLITAGCAALVALPIFYTAWATSGSLTPRLDSKSSGVVQGIREMLAAGAFADIWAINVRPPLLHLTTLQDGSQFFYGGETGILLTVMQPLFFLGAAAALWRMGVVGGLLLLWVLGTVAGNALLPDNTYTARFVVAFPALVLLATLGIRELVGWLRLPFRDDKRWQLPVAVFTALVLGVSGVAYYFGPHLDAANRQIRIFHDHIDVLYRARALPAQTELYLIARESNYRLTTSIWGVHYGILSEFWDYRPTVNILLADDATQAAIAELPTGRRYAFFVEADDTATLAALAARFPNLSSGSFSPYLSIPRDKQYLLLTVGQ